MSFPIPINAIPVQTCDEYVIARSSPQVNDVAISKIPYNLFISN